jgi:hypothetical protein
MLDSMGTVVIVGTLASRGRLEVGFAVGSFAVTVAISYCAIVLKGGMAHS